MRSITAKLIAAFLVASLVGVALVGFFLQQASASAFDQLVVERAQADLADFFANYYSVTGGWQGIDRVLPAPNGETPPPQDDAPAQALPTVGDRVPSLLARFVLVDDAGTVVVPGGGLEAGDHLPPPEVERGLLVEVDGEIVGVVVPVGAPPEPRPEEIAYRRSTEQALFYATIGAAAVAVILSVGLALIITRPLRALTNAIRAMHRGELGQMVPVSSQDEIGELLSAFNQMSADIERANRLRRQMTADIAHELRTPLTVITGYLEGLRDGVLQPTPARFTTLYDEAAQLNRLVDDLRTLSLADAGELAINPAPTDPRELLAGTAAAFEPLAAGRGITLAVTAAGGLPPVRIDAARMGQVLGNLVSNALRYTPEGGTITLAAVRSGGAVQLRVSDTGQGIDPADVPHIFERFYRADRARANDGGESGLGLAIARSIVELHGGAISAASTPGAGTTFTITLPGG